MATELELMIQGGAPWGFRLQGGKEFRTPLRVARVETNGKAYHAGMQVGDYVVSINGIDMSDAFHTGALAAVKRASHQLSMKLQRPVPGNTSVQLNTRKMDANQNEMARPSMNTRVSEAPVLAAPISPVRAEASMWMPPGEHNQKNQYRSQDDSAQVVDVKYNEYYEPRRAEPVVVGHWDDDDRRAKEAMSSDIIDAAVRTPAPINLVENTYRDSRMSSESSHSSAAAERSPSPVETRSSTLPRRLGQKQESDRFAMNDDDRSKTLPGKRGKASANQVPTWYKQMYKEMHNSMEGQSHLTRLLTSDAAKGAFRKYDGATSPNNLRSQSPVERQRPVSMHLRSHSDDNVFNSNPPEPTNERVSVRGLKSTYMEKVSSEGQPKLTRQEERQKRHSVHSTWYRQIQKGGEIPMTGLRAPDGSEPAASKVRQFSKEEGDRPERQGMAQGKTYQKLEKSLLSDEERKQRFEYNNPPDYLELRRKAEADGRLQEERERERRMIEQEKERRMLEEQERRANFDSERERQRRLEEERQQRLAEERQRRLELERREQERERQLAEERRRAEEERLHRERQRIEEERRREQERKLQELERARKEEEKRRAELSNQKAMNGDLTVGHAKALYAFHPQTPSELGFKKGEIIKIVRKIDDNWYEGEHRGKLGIFPVSYVEMLKPTSPPALQVEEGVAKAKYSFKAESPKELSFKKNDMITLLRKVDANWYEGEIGDRIGIFPSSYIEVLKEPKILGKVDVSPPAPVVEDVVDAPVQNHVQESAPPQMYKVIFGYTPMNEDEVELHEGDLVDVLEKCDDGWYVGTNVRTSMFGTFPGNYVVRA